MTITPDELEQLVMKALLKVKAMEKEAPAEMKYYTREQVCEILHISLSTLETYVKKGAITCSRVGKRVLFTQDDIDKALGKNRNN
ncbi:MAG TPA: helix-turn-helix domain-containing protein [Desulfobacterales bacterium]|nr:helix-turn-helix domain-containing protein [Desulfobacterales bacterium]